jgi:hypothetical protein
VSRRPRSAEPPLRAVLGRGDLGGSLLYVFPLFLVYGVGVLLTPSMNGVDFVSRNLLSALGGSTRNYLIAHAAMALGFLGLLAWMRREGALHRLPFGAMLLESAVVALTLGSFIVFVMRNLFGLDAAIDAPPLAAAQTGSGTSIILSLGAGVHEELVFRLGLFSGGAALARLAGLSHGAAVTLVAGLAAALFSAAHHVGAAGDAWAWNVFVYRLLAGLVFTAIFYWRSLAHAVYTHALYDLYVMLVLR